MASPHSLSLGGGTPSSHSSGGPPRKASNLLCPRLLSIPWPNLSVSGSSPCPDPHISCILSLASGWNSKLQVLKGLVMCTPIPIPRQEAQGMPVTVLPLKSLHTVHVLRLEFIVMLSKKLEPGHQPSALDSGPHSPLSQKSYCRGLNPL